MEQFVLGIFQEQLSKFIVGFRKEQINANLLNGKGEIKDVALNCAILNQQLATVTPFVELESVQISRLSFHVTSWTNIRKAPILVDIEDAKATILEPMYYLDRTQRKSIRQVSRAAFIDMIRAALYKPRTTPYNLFDRIADNLTIDIRSVQISFQPWGKFKTRRVGPWTPPTLMATLRHIRIASVDEYGHEGTPEEVWSHNIHPPNQPAAERTLLLYKKIAFECDAGVGYPAASGDDDDVTPPPQPLLCQAKVEVHIAVQRRIRDGAILSVQIDATLPKVEIEIPNSMVPVLAHAVSGVQYCVAKDRAYEDPLLAKSDIVPTPASPNEVSVEPIVEDDDDDGIVEGDEDEEEIDDDDDDIRLNPMSPEAIMDEESFDDAGVDELLTPSTPATPTPSPAVSRTSSSIGGRNHPVLMLPNGLVIYDRVTISVAVHHCTIRGTYSAKGDGYVQLVTKGLIAEMIWPKDKEKGGFAQASLSYVSLQERHGPRIRSILIGGMLQENNGPVERPGKAPRGVSADENFPLYENRSIRDDPLDLRHSFPAQAFGLKTTVSFIDKVSNMGEDDVMFVHEVGIDKFDIVLDTDAWCRALRFAINEDGAGFDPRWHSGDWSDSLSTDMLVKPTVPLNLADHLQGARQILLDENELISSDLLNITAKVTNVEIRIPAAIQDDVRSCDIVLKVDETLLLVSSALPRTFLTGKIGSSINGDRPGQQGVIDFPNDPTDIVYAMEKTEDPSIRQSGVMTSRVVSTFRLQLTVRGLSARITPVIPFCDAKQPQQLLAPMEMTMIVCFEGEPPKEPNSNLIKIIFFVSVLIHRLQINCDFDLIAGAASTLLHHSDVVNATVDTALQIFRKGSIGDKKSPGPVIESNGEMKIRKSLQGRRVVVKRQIARSRETGGFSISFCIQLSEFGFQLWRQHVPLNSPLRISKEARSNILFDDSSIPIIKLVEFNLKGVEVGVEGDFRATFHRLVLKCCVASSGLQVCDFAAEVANHSKLNDPDSVDAQANGDVMFGESLSKMVDVLCFDRELLSTEKRASENNDFVTLRFEDCVEQSRSIGFACDVCSGGILSLRAVEIESLVVLIIEALLMPAWSRSKRALKVDNGVSSFPDRSVGALLVSLARTGISLLSKGSPRAPSVEIPEQPSSFGRMQRPLQAFLSRVVARKIELALARFRVANLIINVPIDPIQQDSLGLHVHDLNVLVGFNATSRGTAMMSSVAGNGFSWDSLFENLTECLKYSITSRQSLHSMKIEALTTTVQTTIMPEFEFKLIPVLSCGDDGASNTCSSFRDIESLVQLLDQALKLSRHFRAMKNAILSLLSVTNSTGEAALGSLSGSSVINALTAQIVFVEAIQSCQSLLQRIQASLECQSLIWRQALSEKQSQLNKIRYVVFEKEKERIGAIALVSSQVVGWVRVGGLNTSGQRAQSSATLWPHFAVLRSTLLFLFESEKEHKPRDVVSLSGARLRQLRGGKRRDIGRGFAIVESGGVTRIFTVASDAEYIAWAQGLRRVIDLSRQASLSLGDQNDVEPDNDDIDMASIDYTPTEAKGVVMARRSLQLGKKLITGAVQVAKTKSQAVAQKRIQQKVTTTDNMEVKQHSDKMHTEAASSGLVVDMPVSESFSNDAIPSEAVASYTTDNSSSRPKQEQLVEAPASHHQVESTYGPGSTRGQQIRGRFSGLRQVTKNKLGSAVQAAKQKGLEVAEKRLQQWRNHGEDVTHQTKSDSLISHQGQTGLSQQVQQPTDRAVQFSSESSKSTESNSILSSWSCGMCTFVNAGHFQVCDVCGVRREEVNPTVLEAPTSASMETVSVRQDPDEIATTTESDQGVTAGTGTIASGDPDDGSLVSDLASDDGELGRRRRMRDRLGAAVRSVRSIALQNDGDGSNKLRPGSVGENTTSGAGVPQAVKLRGIGIGKELTSDELKTTKVAPIEMPLKKLEGHWIVLVTPSPRGSGNINNPMGNAVSVTTNSPESESTTNLPDGDKEKITVGVERNSESSSELEGMTIGDSSTGTDPFKPDFLVRLFTQDANHDLNKSLFSEIRRNFADVYALHTAVSEAVGEYVLLSSKVEPERDLSRLEMGASLASRLGLSPLDMIRFTGKMLAGLLEAPKELESADWERYKCAVLTDFLQSILDSPLPVDALAALEDFLQLGSVHVENAGTATNVEPTESEISQPYADGSLPTNTSQFVDGAYEKQLTDASRDMLAMISVCQTELHGLENNLRLAPNNDSSASTETLPSTSRRPSTFHEPLLPAAVMEDLHEAIHTALMKVMAERDEAHAQLIAANVLHVHEMEQERKKADHLAKQLEVAQKLLRSVNGGPLNFGNDNDKPEVNLKRYQDQMTQNVEAELLSLCQQLAGEISARTAAELEIIRLKESRKLERDGELAEKQALRNELKRVKERSAAIKDNE